MFFDRSIPTTPRGFAASPAIFGLLLLLLVSVGCQPSGEPPSEAVSADGITVEGGDPHSFANADEIAVSHIHLDLDVDFDAEKLRGRASLTLDRKGDASHLVLDTRDLAIEAVFLDDEPSPADYALGEADGLFGRPLVVALEPSTEVVHVDYSTSPGAAALQWLEPAQTAGGEHPFLFSQSQAILARTWVPCQDTPGVRFTYDATLRVPTELLALMSAENPTEKNDAGIYELSMPQAIPSYLLAIAVGDLEFEPLGERAGVYAEPAVLESAAYEFADTETMMAATEALYGPYRWGRYDLLVLPPSFPFGGMENPRLTFATPTILAGDRSLVSLVAHELAHSWSGNLVTNATWNDFWLNEGFTSYLELRIMEALEGKPYADMLALLSRQDLAREIEEMGPTSADTHLRLELAGRDPDDGMTSIAYDKGQLFLRTIEETVGRERFDPFLRQYFDEHAFEPMTSDDFIADLRDNLVQGDAALEEKLMIDAWIDGPGVPANAAVITSAAFEKVEAELEAWRGGRAASKLAVGEWSTHEWLHFLRSLPEDLTLEEMSELDAAFGFTESGNSEILFAWFPHAIDHGYAPAEPAFEAFLVEVGRRKFVVPLFERLVAAGERERAEAIYAKARPGYHPLTAAGVDEVLDEEAG